MFARAMGMVALAACLVSRFAPAQADLPARATPARTASRLGVELYGVVASGWVVQELDREEGRTTNVDIGTGRGAGLRISYGLSPRVAGYLAADLNVEQEGVYPTYGAGMRLQTIGRLRFGARAGGRVIDVVAPLVYADLGIFGELSLAPVLALGLDLSTAVPLGDGSRNTGTHRVGVAARGGPERAEVGLVWYPSR
jgi:hypothetical protein